MVTDIFTEVLCGKRYIKFHDVLMGVDPPAQKNDEQGERFKDSSVTDFGGLKH
jgi:hypothetical protein